jgi:hypothetical protein
MSSFILKNNNFIANGKTINKSSTLNIEIPTVSENNILSYNYITFINIINQNGIDISDNIPSLSQNIKVNSFGYDNLPLYILDIENKNSKNYELT